MTQVKKRFLALLLVISLVVVLDQAVKWVVLDRLAYGESYAPIPALSGYFQLTHSTNTGAAFGLFANAGDLFLVLALIVVGVMLYYYPRIPEAAVLTRLAIGLVCGGALGNAIDRVAQGHVIDFIHYRIPGLISNVSNLADHAIVFGVILLLLDSWRIDHAARVPDNQETGESPKADCPEIGYTEYQDNR